MQILSRVLNYLRGLLGKSIQTSLIRKIKKHIFVSFGMRAKCFNDSVYTPHTVTFTAENEDDNVGQICR